MLKNLSEKFYHYKLVYIFASFYSAIMFYLMVQKHNAFNTRLHDFARFAQAIWNTLDGQFLYTSFSERSILGDHFSPIMSLASPLLWIWPDERVLFLVQTLNVAATGIIIYYIAHAKQPKLAPIIAILFFLNPAVHEVHLFEFRRIVFGMPWLALGLYGLLQNNYRLMLIGLLIALLAKESIAIYVLMIGVYILLIKRDWRWGVGLMALGLAWAYIVGDYVILIFNTNKNLYPQLYYYDHLGESYGDIIRLFFTDPMRIINTLVGDPQLGALFRVFLPFGFLILLDIPMVLIILPYLGLMFLSRDVDMFQLDKWYTTTITPVLFAALISGWQRIPKKMENWAIGWLLIATGVSFSMHSYAPFGGRFDSKIYEVTERDRVSELMTDRVPLDAAVESHPRYLPHLVHLNEVYHYLFAKDNPIDYLLVDKQVQFHPFGPFENRDEVINLVAETKNVVVEEVDDIFLLGVDTPQLPAYEVDKTVDKSIRLDRVEFAVADADGFFTNTIETMPEIRGADQVRITLYWTALADEIGERSISIRLASDGQILAQHDQWPANGYRPTSTWTQGLTVRDVYYLTVPEGVEGASGNGSVDIVVYDTYSQQSFSFEGEDIVMSLLSFKIAP